MSRRGLVRDAQRAAFVIVYLLGVGLFLEAGSRALLAFPRILNRAPDTNAWWRLHWVSRRAAQGPSSYTFDVYHPTRGWALRPGLRAVPALHGRPLSSNSKGLRGHREYANRKTPGVLRVEVFGDSFTFGEDVGDDETYAACLERRSAGGVEVLNFGVHGYGHDQMLLYLREQGLEYHPDVVVLGFVDWDMARNLLDFRDYAKPRFDLVEGRLVLRNVPVPRPEEVLAAERYRSRFLDLLGLIGASARLRFDWTRAESERVTAALLDDFRRTLEAEGATLVIAFLPAEAEIASKQPVEGERFVLDYCRARGVQSIDLRPAFLARVEQGEHLKTRGHWSRREHALAADALADGLGAAGLLRPAARDGVARSLS